MRILAHRLPVVWQDAIRRQVSPDWHLVYHAQARQQQKGITDTMLYHCLAYGRLLEINDDVGHLRALLRDKHGTCVVVDFQNQMVVTCYRNNPSDHHSTLNRALYYWGAITPQLLQRLCGGDLTNNKTRSIIAPKGGNDAPRPNH